MTQHNNPELIVKHGTQILLPEGDSVKMLQQHLHAPRIHGSQVWNTTFVLMDYLVRNPPPAGKTLMDVGCGWGALSSFAAKKLDMESIAVDADPYVFPFVELHAEINQVKVQQLVRRFEEISSTELSQVHTLVGTEICFWDRLQPDIYNMIERALEAGVSQIIIADPGRGPFHALSDRCEMDFNGQIVIAHTHHPVKDSAELLIIDRELLPY